MMKLLTVKSLIECVRVPALTLLLLAIPAVAPSLLMQFGFQLEMNASGMAFAQEEKKPKPKTKVTQAIQKKDFEKIEEAQAFVEAKDFPAAIKILDALTNNAKKPINDAGRAMALQTYAFIYYTQEDYARAIKSYQDITKLEKASEGLKIQAKYSIAQLYFVTEQWQRAVDAVLEWMSLTDIIGADAYVLLSQGYYQLKKYDLALVNVEKAIRIYKDKGKTPKENWYSLQRFFYYEKDNYVKVVEILEEMLLHYPKKAYWTQLSGMYGELKNEPKQLASYEVIYTQGLLDKENELTRMAYLFLGDDIPYKAAKVLDKGIREKTIKATSRNLELLGASWRQAQEIDKAIPEMAKAAAKSEKGELWARLCNLYLDSDEFKKAIDACNKGLKKGGVKRPDTTHLILGMAHFSLKQYKSARSAFNCLLYTSPSPRDS